ncbi:hypothetical protein R1sor_002456 [Riccia sorocarpa]|uniref:FCP1 homology domain-containing protein n=1 Tax=Riccia sorocarpa TaxID=122646 RepID=A0ABD3H1J7_9MARC
MPEVIQYQDLEDVESQEESEHGQSHEESERESASRSSGEHEELDEVDDDDEDEDPESLDFADLGNMVMYSDTRDFKGPWHVEIAKVGYSHIGNSTFPIKEEFSLFLKIESKWSLQGVVAFMADVPKESDLLCAESSDAMANSSKKDEEKLLKTDFNKFMSMYPFGTSAVFPIAVEKIVEAPSIFVYRSVNDNYVLETFKKMVEKPHITPQIADLLPYSKSKKMTVKLDAYAADKKIKMSEPEKVVKALSNDSDIVFLAISGQHSSRAQQLILQERRLPEKIRNQNCFRKSRQKIVDGTKEATKRAGFERQEPDIRSEYFHFKSIVTQTMRRKSHKEVILLVFRPVNGLLDKELRLVWTELENGSVCITKPAKLQGLDDIVTLKDFCKAIKGKRALGTRIVNYWETRYQEEFDLWDDLARSYNFPEKWLDGMLKFIPDKPDKETAVEETVVEDVSSSDEEEGSKKKKKPKKKSGFVEPLPSQVVTSLHRIYCVKHGEELPERLEPFAVLHLHKDISQYQLTLDEKLTCKLVFLDLTHPDLIPWEKQQFSSFLSIVRELTVATEFVIVSVMEFDQQLVNFSSALNDMKDARALLECGAYEGDRSKREVEFSYPCWQLVYAFVSLGPQDYKHVLVENPKLRPFSVEFEPKHADVERQVKEDDQPTNIKMKAPRWEFVGMEALNDRGLVHPLSKRAAFCSRLLANFSAEENTVLDFFSGGVFTREALLMARDVIYFANSEPEAKFVAKYSKELVRHSERVQKWFARYKAAKKPASLSQPGGASQLASTSQAALTSQRSSPSHHDEQSKEDELAVAEDEEPFVLDDILKANAVERLGNRATIEFITKGYAEEIKSVTEAISEEFKDKQVDGGTGLDPNLLSEVDGGVGLVPTVPSAVGGGTDLVPVVPSEVGGGSDLAPTPPSEVEEKTDEVPTLLDDFILRGEYDSIKERSAAEVMKGTETEEHHGVPAEHIDEHLEPSEQSNAPTLLAQTSDGIDIDQVVDEEITESGTMDTKEADDQRSSDQRQDDQVVRFESGLLAPIETPISWVPDLNQVPNPLVKASDLLPRKLLILDVEGLLLYAEGFMDRSSKTAAGDVVGTKKVIRRYGVQEFITRCLELFDIALWTCSDRNLLYDYTHYLFSGEQWDKFLFRWDQGKALDTKERWTRNNREIRLILKPLKTVWERFPDFNARNTLLVDVHPYRASANPEDTGIFPKPFTGSYSDKYLTTVLLPYLEGLSQAFDIREYVREHVLQGSQRPLHFRSTSRGLPRLLHKFSLQAVETFVPPLLTKKLKLTDSEKSILSRLPNIEDLEDHDCVAWARLLGLSWNQNLQDDLITIGLVDENPARHTRTKASVKYARDFLLEVKRLHFA